MATAEGREGTFEAPGSSWCTAISLHSAPLSKLHGWTQSPGVEKSTAQSVGGKKGRPLAKGMDSGRAGEGKLDGGDWTDDASTTVVIGLTNLVDLAVACCRVCVTVQGWEQGKKQGMSFKIRDSGSERIWEA